MCTLVTLFRPGRTWPLLVGANRDEMESRPSDPPARHWPEFPGVVAGRDLLSGGSWLGVNDQGLFAALLNRRGTLGPLTEKRSRGALVVRALSQATVEGAQASLLREKASDFRGFYLVVADGRQGFCLSGEDGASFSVEPLPEGFSFFTAEGRNATASPRSNRYFPLFQAAPPPEPERGIWQAWISLLGSREADPGAGETGAMTFRVASGFGTVSSSLLALPAPGAGRPIWLFSPGPPDRVAYRPVSLA